MTHSVWEIAAGITNPFFGVPTYLEGTFGWGPGWLDVQVGGFAGPGAGKKVEGTVRESPRTPGLTPEAKASVSYLISKSEVSVDPDLVEGKVPGSVKLSVGPLSRTGEFTAYPGPAWNGWNRVSAQPPKAPSTGLGWSVAAGGRWNSEVVNLGDVVRSAIAQITGGSATPGPASPDPIGPTAP